MEPMQVWIFCPDLPIIRITGRMLEIKTDVGISVWRSAFSITRMSTKMDISGLR